MLKNEHVFLYMYKGVLRYPGGKTRAIATLANIIEKYKFNVSTVISPFIGGASFELYLSYANDSKIIANDKFRPLYLFWHYLQEQPDKLIARITQLRPLSKARFAEIKDDLTNSDVSKMRRAAYYFAVNRSSFSGSTTKGGYSKEAAKSRFNGNSILRLDTINLDDFTFSNLDFTDFLNDNENMDTFIFADPPYYLDENLYGVDEKFKHKKLCKLMKQRNNWIICYNDCPYIRKLYVDVGTIEEVEWSYSMNSSKKSNEIVIIRKNGKPALTT